MWAVASFIRWAQPSGKETVLNISPAGRHGNFPSAGLSAGLSGILYTNGAPAVSVISMRLAGGVV